VGEGQQVSHTYPYNATGSPVVYNLRGVIKENGFPDFFSPYRKLTLKAAYSHNNALFVPPNEVWEVANAATLSPPVQGAFPPGSAYNSNQLGGAHAYIRYAPAHNGKLLKPLIFVDGIDFNDKVYTYNGEVVRHGSTGWDVFTMGVDFSEPDPDDPLPSVFRNFPSAFQTLQSAPNDFDIVFLDFGSGADWIQKNGLVLVKLLEEVNERKRQYAKDGEITCDNVVVGASMGGQVAKWALSYMEENNLNHQTHTYVSFDSPHKGANIPLSLQAFVFLLNRSGQDADNFWGSLNSPAARQMLIESFSGALESTKIDVELEEVALCDGLHGTFTPVDPAIEFGGSASVRTQFEGEMAGLGYPANTRNVAISCGSSEGVEVGLDDGQTILLANLNPIVPDLGCPLDGDLYRAECATVNGNSMPIPEMMSFGDGFGDCCSASFPGAPNTLFRGLVPINFANWPFTPNDVPTTHLMMRVLATQNLPHLDNAPGCLRSDIRLFRQQLRKIQDMNVPVFSPSTCFMPTLSLLDIQWPMDDQHLTMPFNPNDIPGLGLTPFDACYAEQTNLRHVELTSDMINWTLQQAALGLSEASATLTLTAGQVFNYGFRKNRVPTTVINSGATLAVNLSGKINYMTPQDLPASKPHFEVFTGSGCSDGQLIVVKNGGLLQIGDPNADKTGVLHALEGSVIRVETGGTLRLSKASRLLIYEGAQLILESGANVQIDNNGASIEIDGEVIVEQNVSCAFNGPESAFIVRGKIIWNGDINYSGLGYFDFTSGYQIEFAPNLPQFRLIGQTPYNRFLRLQAPLNLPAGMDLNLQNGGVEYTAGGTIAASNGAEVNLQAMRLYGTATLAFDAYGCGKIDIQNSRFEGLEQVGNVYGGTTNNKCTITNSTFSGYFFGLYIVNRQEVNLTNCTFASTGGGITLLSHNNVVTRMKGCQIDGSGSGAGVGLNGGLLFWMDGGRISNCTDGIFCAADQSGFEPANILLSNHATIENCENGVRADGNLTKGLLVATCSHFLHNKTGIRGTDLRLLLNWTQLTPSNLYARKPNRFLRASDHANADRYIDVCYRTFNPGTINAGHNLWLEDGFTGPVIVSNPLPHIRAAFSATNVDCVNGIPLSVIAAPAAANQAQICLTEETPDPGPCIRCDEFTGGGGTVIDQFEAAFVQLPEDEAEEDVYTALERFSPVANLWQAALPESLSHTCKDYIRAARSLTEGLADIGPRQQAAPLAPGTQLVLRPNPAAQGTWIDLPGTPVTIRVFDAFGQLKHQFATAASSHWLDTAAWPGGAYSVQVWDASGYTKSAVLIIQR